eukprot:451600_1
MTLISNRLNMHKKKYETSSHLNQPIHLGLFQSDYMQNKSDHKWGQIEINAASASVSGWQPCQLQFDLNKYILSRYANLDIETWHPDPTQPHVSTNSNNIYFPVLIHSMSFVQHWQKRQD